MSAEKRGEKRRWKVKRKGLRIGFRAGESGGQGRNDTDPKKLLYFKNAKREAH